VKYPKNWTVEETNLLTYGVILEPINALEAQRVGLFAGEAHLLLLLP
jgi:hypothetical protein